MKAIEIKNPLFLLTIGKFVASAIEMEQYLDLMLQVAPEDKKQLVQDLSNIIESMVPVVEKLKVNEIPPELEAYIKEAMEKGETLQSASLGLKSDKVGEKSEEDAIDDLLDQVNKKYK